MKYLLDLRSIFNNREVYPQNYKSDAMIGEANNYIVEENFIFNKEITVNDYKFIYRRNKKFFDNVSCEEQRLNINNLFVSKILFVGFSTWGGFREKFKFISKEGADYNYDVCLSETAMTIEEAYKHLNTFSEQLYFDGNFMVGKIQWKLNDGKMWAYEIVLDSPMFLSKIVFPNNENMHIFAITLE